MHNHPHYQRGNIYLSGGMQFKEDLGAGWRSECSTRLLDMEYLPLDIAALDIAYFKLHGEHCRSLEGLEGHLQKKSNIRRQFIFTDVALIKNDADAVILLYDNSVRLGAGTISEAQITYDLGLPLFVVNTYKNLQEIPGWLQALSTRIFNEFEELYVYLHELPFGILKKDVYGNLRAGSHYLCSLCGDPFEKHKTHFVSHVSPLYCKRCVDVVNQTYEHYDRYQFFIEELERQSKRDVERVQLAKANDKRIYH